MAAVTPLPRLRASCLAPAVRAARPALAVATPPASARSHRAAAVYRRRRLVAAALGLGLVLAAGAGGCGARRVLPRRPRAPPAVSTSVVVEPGDSLWSIAERARARRRSRDRSSTRWSQARGTAAAACRARRSPGSTTDARPPAARRSRVADERYRGARALSVLPGRRRQGRRLARRRRRRRDPAPAGVPRAAGVASPPTSGSRSSRSWSRKRSGASEPFDRAKLARRDRAGGRPAGSIDGGGRRDRRRGRGGARGPRAARSPSERVGLAVLERLRALDPVAYLRFASVYKGFEDLADFEREVGRAPEDDRAEAPRRARPRPEARAPTVRPVASARATVHDRGLAKAVDRRGTPVL